MRKAIVLLAALVALPSFSAVDTTTVSGKVLLPSGAAATGGKIVCELSQAASAADGAGVQRVASRVTATIGTDGTASIPLAPNDILTPAGTYYTCKFTIITPASASWTEKWSLASSPDPVDIGSVSRLDVAPGTTTGVYVVALATCSGACPNGGVCIDKDDAAQYYCYLGNWTRQDLPPCSPDPPTGTCIDGGVCQSVSSGWALYGCYSGAWAAVTGSGGSSVSVDGAAVGNPDFVDTGDIDFDATPTGQIIGTIQADSVALGTDTTGNYISSATASQGLTVTGTEGASVGIQDCAAGQILKRNVGDTAWECASDDTAVGGTVSISGTPATNQVGLWASSSAMAGDADLVWDGTNRLTATNLTVTNTITGSISGNAATATVLAADGANCSAGQYPLGVSDAGAVQSCTADDDTPDSDAEVPDAITISATGSVAWTALTSYPAACSAGQYVSTIGDTLTCSTPTASTATSIDGDADGTANVTADADSVDFSLDGTGTVARIGSDGSYIQIAATADGQRGATFQDNTAEPSAPASGYTLLYALSGELYKKDNGDGLADRLLLNSGNLAGDITVDATGNASIGNDKVTPNDVLSTGQTDEYCLTYEATGATWAWQACALGSNAYATSGIDDDSDGTNMALSFVDASDRVAMDTDENGVNDFTFIQGTGTAISEWAAPYFTRGSNGTSSVSRFTGGGQSVWGGAIELYSQANTTSAGRVNIGASTGGTSAFGTQIQTDLDMDGTGADTGGWVTIDPDGSAATTGYTFRADTCADGEPLVYTTGGSGITCGSGAVDLDGNGTATSADFDGNGTADETGTALAGTIYAPHVISAATSGAVDFDGDGTKWSPGRTHVSAIMQAQSHASLYGNPATYLKGGLYDAYTDVFRGHPLHANYDGDGTAGDDGVGTGGETTEATIPQCYQANCSVVDQYICISTPDPDSDGTNEFVVGDVIVVGNTTNANTPKVRSHLITASAVDGTNCGTGNTKLTVIPGVDQTGEGVAANVKVQNIWHNSYHPSTGGYYFLGYKLGQASRMMYGAHGPNLIRNGNADWDGGSSERVENWTQTDGDGSLYGGSFAATPATFNQCFEGSTSGNECFYSLGGTSTKTETKDSITVHPGEWYVLSGWYQAHYTETIGLASDSNADGTWSFETGMSEVVGSSQYWYNQTLAPWPFWYAFEIPQGVHKVKPTILRASATATWVDDWTLRKVDSSFLTDSIDDATHMGRATRSFLINDPGSRLVVVTGDSWAAGSTDIRTGLSAALEDRYGRSFSSQVVNTGNAGDTAADLLDRFYDAVEKYEPLYAVFVIGTNDAFGSVATSDFVRNVREIQRRCMSIGTIPIFVSVNPVGVGPWGAGTTFTRSHDLRDAQRRAFLND